MVKFFLILFGGIILFVALLALFGYTSLHPPIIKKNVDTSCYDKHNHLIEGAVCQATENMVNPELTVDDITGYTYLIGMRVGFIVTGVIVMIFGLFLEDEG